MNLAIQRSFFSKTPLNSYLIQDSNCVKKSSQLNVKASYRVQIDVGIIQKSFLFHDGKDSC